MSSTVATPSTPILHCVGEKRRLSEAPESSAPEAKRKKSTGGSYTAEGGRKGEPIENKPPEDVGDATPSAGDKKKRKNKKRKKKKVPIVQKNAGDDAADEQSVSGNPERTQIKSDPSNSSPTSARANATPGPSRLSPSLSASPERLRSPAPLSAKTLDVERSPVSFYNTYLLTHSYTGF
jgi:hypothetical protein